MVNLALIDLGNENNVQGTTEDGLVQSDASDSDDNNSEINSLVLIYLLIILF